MDYVSCLLKLFLSFLLFPQTFPVPNSETNGFEIIDNTYLILKVFDRIGGVRRADL